MDSFKKSSMNNYLSPWAHGGVRQISAVEAQRDKALIREALDHSNPTAIITITSKEQGHE